MKRSYYKVFIGRLTSIRLYFAPNLKIAKHLKILRNDGWDKRAIRYYIGSIAYRLHQNDSIDYSFEQAHEVGSDLYAGMLANSNLSPKEKLTLMLDKHLGAKIDNLGFLQLNPPGAFKMRNAISPLSPYFVLMRDLVIQAFHRTKEKSLNGSDLGKKIHLFRSQLDLTYITYIRQYFGLRSRLRPNATDFDRLQEFMFDNKVEADYSTGASFHNRFHDEFTYPKNMKVQLMKDSKKRRLNNGRMIEFIINLDTLNFESEWDAYAKHMKDGKVIADAKLYSDEELRMIANTESFNYGLPYGGKENHVPRYYKQTHNTMDVKHPADPALRRQATKYYRFQKDYNKGGRYADIVKNGLVDVKAWQKVPLQKRQATYDKYVQALQANKASNQGIAQFLQK